MKPVAIFRFLSIEEPGYLVACLDNNHIPWQLIRIDEGQVLPTDISQFSGLVLMGGSMSVNDKLPWIEPMLTLIQQAVASDTPVLGHCLGGQLIAKALGGEIRRSITDEIGWGTVRVADNSIARGWLGSNAEFESFHWHGEMFTLPDGASQLLCSHYCENQAFAIGIHVAMQCHIEMTAEMVKTWCAASKDEISQKICPAVQSAEEMLTNLPKRIAALNKVAKLLYTKWIVGLQY